MTLLSIEILTVLRGQCPVVDCVSLSVQAGEFIGLIGPNGAGKTTLMRATLGLVAHSGHSSLTQIPAAERAKQAAWIPQMREIAWGLSVRDVVGLGRSPYGPVRRDDPKTQAALDQLGLSSFADRTAIHLSGGEQARVLIARALAQDTPIIMADEPTASLDPASQLTTLQIFADLAAQGHGIIASLHDLGLAARYCHKLALLHRGQLVAFGPPASVLTPENLRDVFMIDAHFEHIDQGVIFQPLNVVTPNAEKGAP
jgi:iron complex transport system ATP-binding protein